MDENNKSPLTESPTINEPSNANFEIQDEKDDYSEYQVLWSKTMDKGQYKSSSTYTNVEVLLLCWAESSDDLAVKEEVSKLKSTFETSFNYNTQISYLDAKIERKLQVQVNTIVAAFIGAHDGPTTLLIVYYAGHGKPGSYYGSLVLHGLVDHQILTSWLLTTPGKLRKMIERRASTCSCGTRPRSFWRMPKQMSWKFSTGNLTLIAEKTVLTCHQSCYAGNLCLTRGEHRLVVIAKLWQSKFRLIKSRLFEYLAATKEMATTACPGENSFTEALIWALEALVNEKVRFTTSELKKKIKLHAPFPKAQMPVLDNRKDGASAGGIMLHPLKKVQENGLSTTLLSEEIIDLDPFKRRTVTLHFDFSGEPSLTAVEMLGKEFNTVFERGTLGVNRVRWGGMEQSLAARALGNFRAAGKKRYRRTSLQKRQVVLDDDGSKSHEDNLTPLTPTSNGHSPPLMEVTAESTAINSPTSNPKSLRKSLESSEESEGQTEDRRRRYKKQKSGMDSEDSS